MLLLATTKTTTPTPSNLWQAYDALHDVSPEVFAQQLQHVIVGRNARALILLVVDATDPEHSAVKNLRRLIGGRPAYLVLNKSDLLPRLNYYDQHHLARRIQTVTGGTQFLETHAVSAVTGHGVHALAESLLGTLGGKDVIMVGAANVGKTTLVRQLATRLVDAVPRERAKSAEKRREIVRQLDVTGSHLPGTTLQAVRIPCLPSPKQALWDTPGVINHKAIQYALFPSHLMEPLTRPEAIPLPDE